MLSAGCIEITLMTWRGTGECRKRNRAYRPGGGLFMQAVQRFFQLIQVGAPAVLFSGLAGFS